MSDRLDALLEKYQRQRAEVEAGRRSLVELEREAQALGEKVGAEAIRIRKRREDSQFGRVAYDNAEITKDQAALHNERMRLETIELDAGRLRRQVREQSTLLRQTGGLVVQEQRRTAAPLLHARRDGLLAEISELLPKLAAVSAICAVEPAELFAGPTRTLNMLERSITDRAAFRDDVFHYYGEAMRAVGLDASIER